MFVPVRRQQKTRRARRQTGFVCPAWYPQAGADLALAAFVTRPQAEAQIGAKGTLPHFATAVKIFDADCDAAAE
jgi:hypothetical protein